jgi:hypothetical protein
MTVPNRAGGGLRSRVILVCCPLLPFCYPTGQHKPKREGTSEHIAGARSLIFQTDRTRLVLGGDGVARTAKPFTQFNSGHSLQSNWLIFHKNSISIFGSTDPACHHFLPHAFSPQPWCCIDPVRSHPAGNGSARQQAVQIGAAP